MNFKRIFALLLVHMLLLNMTSLAAFDADRNNVAQITVHPISPGLDYTSTIEVCDGIRQEIKSFTYEPGSATEIVPAYGQYIYGFNSVGELVSDYDGEGRLVGGINTDFFITSTGIPLSCFISEGEIISSCDNRPALGFDGDGNAFIGYPNIRAIIKNDSRELPVAHINKTPAVWGLYLVTDSFAKSTKSSVESIEIVFRSYDREKSEKAIEEYLSSLPEVDEDYGGDDDGNADDDTSDVGESVEDTEEDIEENSEIVAIEDSKQASEDLPSDFAVEVNQDSSDESEQESIGADDSSENEKESEITDGVEVDSEEKKEASEVNESDSRDDLSEDSSSGDEESDPEKSEAEEDIKIEIPIELYELTEENVTLNCSHDIVVTDIRDGVKNSDIPENSFVLCVPKEQFGYMVDDIKVGDCFTLETDCNKDFYEAENVFGAGSIILENGEFVKQTNDSIYLYRNPRTAAGIKSDGTVVFVCVDGRHAGVSNGFTITELADYLLSLGCVDAVNFDGGGSTTFYVADIGEKNASLKNTPSEKSERRVANGMLFVNTDEPSEKRTYATLSPKHFLTFNKGVVTDISGEVSFADSNGFPMPLLSHESIILAVDERFGFTHNGYFVPSGKVGRAEIIARIPESEETYYVGFVEITDTVDSLNFKSDDELLTPFEGSSGLSVTPLLNTLPVDFTHRSVDWKIEAETKLEDEVEYSEVDESEAYLYVNDSTVRFIPVLRDVKYRITASMGDYSESVEIFAEAHPFVDMERHWASETSYEMYKNGLILGELSDEGIRSFMPSRNMTRAEFCTVLARILKLDTSAYSELKEEQNMTDTSEGTDEMNVDFELDNAESDTVDIEEALELEVDNTEFSGVSEFIAKSDSEVEADSYIDAKEPEKVYTLSDVPEWARGYVYALYTEGYIDSLIVETEDGVLTINADDFITRADVIRVLGSLLEGDGDPEALEKFPDYVPTSDEDALYFSRIIESGIIGGYEDGTVRADGCFTRAEAATVFSRFIAKFE